MRNRSPMRVILALMTVGLVAGCLRPAAQESAQQIPLSVLFKSTQCDAARKAFGAIWISRPGQFGPIPGGMIGPRPFDPQQWDPQTEGALLIHMGTQRTGGFHLELDGPTATLQNGVATILIRLQEPAPKMFTTQVITSPCLLLKIPKSGIEQIHIRDQDGHILSKIQVPATP